MKKMNEKQKNLILMMPRIAIIMITAIYCSGFVKTNLDMLWVVMGISFLAVVLFFIPTHILNILIEKKNPPSS